MSTSLAVASLTTGSHRNFSASAGIKAFQRCIGSGINWSTCCRGLSIQSEGINPINGVVANVKVKICGAWLRDYSDTVNISIENYVPAAETNGVFGDEPSLHRVVVPCPVIVEPGLLIPLSSRIGIAVLKDRFRRQKTEAVIAVFLNLASGRIGDSQDATQAIRMDSNSGFRAFHGQRLIDAGAVG